MDDNEELEPFITGYLNQPRSRRVTAPQTAPPHHTRSEQEEAVAYLNMVKTIFHDRMEKYSEFLDVMKGFRRGRIDTEGVVVRVKELFEGHDELILGFNSFLPDGCKIEISQRRDTMAPALEGSTTQLTTNEALAYLKLVVTIFQDRMEKYHEFFNVLKEYKSMRIGTEGVVMRVKELFKGHNDLILGFNAFLQNGYEIEISEENFLIERQDSMASAPEGTTRKLTMDDASAYLKLVRTIFEDRIETYHEFLDVLKDYKSLRIDTEGVVMRVKELFEGHNDLILGFNSFLPDGYEIKLPEEHAC